MKLPYKENTLIALIDGDEVAYKVGFSLQHTWYNCYKEQGQDTWDVRFRYKKQATAWVKMWDHGEDAIIEPVVSIEKIDNVFLYIRSVMKTILRDTACKDYRVFLSPPVNFRHEVATIQRYKDRPIENKPVYLELARKILREEYHAEDCINIEADDAMSMSQDTNTIICTQDKDLNMVPGWRYSIRSREIRYISEDEGNHFFYCQLLSGDSTDNIPGIKGIGLITADKIFKKAGCTKVGDNYYQVALGEYKKAIDSGKFNNPKGLTIPEILLELGTLLWMRRGEVGDFIFP